MFSEKKLIYFFICCNCITISFNIGAIAAVIPAISRDLNLSALEVSRIISFYMIPYGIGALIYAPLTRFFSYKLLLSLPIGLYSLAALFCASITSLQSFFVGRMAMGLCGASAIPLGLMVIGELFDKNIRGRLVGLFFGCSFAASLLGIVISGLLSWRWLFWVPSILGLLTFLGLILTNSKLLSQKHGEIVNYFLTLKNETVFRIFLFIFCISFLYHGIGNWFGVYLDRIYHLDKFMISVLFVCMNIAGVFGQMLGGIISDKKSRYQACYIGILVLSLSSMLLIREYPLFVVAIVLSLISVGWTIGHNGMSTILTDFESENRPAIASLNSAVRYASGGLGFYVSSFFVDKSFGATFFFIGLALLFLSQMLRKFLPATTK